MDEIRGNVRRLLELSYSFNREHDEEIKRIEEEATERFLKNLPFVAQTKKKKTCQDDSQKENESVNKRVQAVNDQASLESSGAPLRPVRTAKLNASKNLKEPDLAKKMRQPSSQDPLLNAIKEEPMDIVQVKREASTGKKVKQEKISLMPPPPPPTEAPAPRTSKDSEDNSVELMAPVGEIVEILSDNEAEKMPPPALPAPKARKARTKKKKASKGNVSVERPIRESRIKKEAPTKSSDLLTVNTSSGSRQNSRKASAESHYEDALTDVEVPSVPSDATQVIERHENVEKSSTALNATFDIAEGGQKEAAGATAAHNNSIMTEDNSIELPPEASPEPLPQKSATKKKHPHELFNPCVQSPLRTKVEAFERHAAASALPIATGPASGLRGKGTQGRTMQGTPISAKGSGAVLQKCASTSKLADFSAIVAGAKKKSKAGTSSASKATTRSASAEDTKRGLNALQQLAEEKRRKREERHKQAQLAREAKEREKEEKYKRLMLEQQEREEKQRAERIKALKAKTAQEKEQARKMEELQKLKMLKYRVAETPKYGFEMLASDDSTDDEDKAAPKRPPPPLWSMKPRRNQLNAIQEQIPALLIDKLFMCKPLNPDLKEIFPDIDPRNLHRNSSVLWKTPPRASQDFL
ncbi:calponin homology domain-containing protein DDB_G0272472 [Lutzomyia longipalpis]|uniref:calponin homology domain-containing protein DDB_G0272472 n=1 Tax=Lutzomyia longipalpis TaxID=7200 RepID=UPI002483E9A8|nr:calponin homology domain-containing protein DDB_G0272472 [Lutzomyia longipalpis]